MFRSLLLGLALLLAAPAASLAQALHVVAMDSNANRPLQNALVVLLDREADVVSIHRTDKKGQTKFTGLATGYYALKVSARGFSDRTTAWIALSDVDTLQATVRLGKVAQLLDLVVVSSERDSAARYLPVGVSPAMGATVMPPGLIDNHAPGSGDYVSLINSLGVKSLTVRYWRRSEYEHTQHSCIQARRGPSQGCALLFINDVRVDDYAVAKDIIFPEQVGWVVYVPPIHAGLLYGDMANQGALLIYTKDRLTRIGGPGR